MVTRLEFQEGNSSKFWEISQSGGKLTIKYGKLGSGGQTTLKDLGTADKAKKQLEKEIAGKKKKGYAEVASGGRKPRAKPAAKAVPAPKRATP
eukprot:gene9229-18370_t